MGFGQGLGQAFAGFVPTAMALDQQKNAKAYQDAMLKMSQDQHDVAMREAANKQAFLDANQRAMAPGTLQGLQGSQVTGQGANFYVPDQNATDDNIGPGGTAADLYKAAGYGVGPGGTPYQQINADGMTTQQMPGLQPGVAGPDQGAQALSNYNSQSAPGGQMERLKALALQYSHPEMASAYGALQMQPLQMKAAQNALDLAPGQKELQGLQIKGQGQQIDIAAYKHLQELKAEGIGDVVRGLYTGATGDELEKMFNATGTIKTMPGTTQVTYKKDKQGRVVDATVTGQLADGTPFTKTRSEMEQALMSAHERATVAENVRNHDLQAAYYRNMFGRGDAGTGLAYSDADKAQMKSLIAQYGATEDPKLQANIARKIEVLQAGAAAAAGLPFKLGAGLSNPKLAAEDPIRDALVKRIAIGMGSPDEVAAYDRAAAARAPGALVLPPRPDAQSGGSPARSQVNDRPTFAIPPRAVSSLQRDPAIQQRILQIDEVLRPDSGADPSARLRLMMERNQLMGTGNLGITSLPGQR